MQEDYSCGSVMFASLRNPTWGLPKDAKVAVLLRGTASGDGSADCGSDGS